MSKPKSIQINIPQPCSQNRDEMAVIAGGRFCCHCQKTVIDFSTWSDTALYNFFSKNKEHVCGTFLAAQLERPIHIPYQPHSRLYRMTVALGLTLLFTQTPHLLAQNRPPKASQIGSISNQEPNKYPSSEIHGQALNNAKEPIEGVTIQVFQGKVLTGSAKTNGDGRYVIYPLKPGDYYLIATNEYYKKRKITSVIVSKGYSTTIDLTLEQKQENDNGIVITAYKHPLIDGGVAIVRKDKNSELITGGPNSAIILPGYQKMKEFANIDSLQPKQQNKKNQLNLDMDNPTKKTFTHEEINQMPH